MEKQSEGTIVAPSPDGHDHHDHHMMEKMEKGSEEIVTATGHVQELERNFSMLNMCATAVVIGGCWAITGSSIILSIYNGGSPGVIFEFLAAGLCYLTITASLAELASAIPSSAGVYHWASITPGRRAGRVVGFFAGYWNGLAYCFGTASLCTACAQAIIQMWQTMHPDLVNHRWQVFVVMQIIVWLCAGTALFANRFLPQINNALMFFTLAGWLVTLVAVAAFPASKGRDYMSTKFVFRDWQNNSGYSSQGLVFVLGMLNGSFNIGTPDCSSHMAEEVAQPEKNIPKAMAAQMVIGLLTTLLYLIVLFYGITNWDDILALSAEFPITPIYQQITGSPAGAVGLTVVLLVPLLGGTFGSTLTSSRMMWTLARDEALPFASFFGHISPRWKNPFNAIVLVGSISTILGCIYLGSETAFQAFVGSFTVMTTFSYLAAIVPYMLRGRKGIMPGPFHMPGLLGWAVNIFSCGYMSVWVVFYCFPYTKTFTLESFNWSSLMAGGVTILMGCWWLVHQRRYKGPPVLLDL